MLGIGVLGLMTAQAAVVVNEFEPDPAGADGGFEWVELYNDAGASVDLTDWTIRRATSGTLSARFTFPAGASIPANGYVVVGGEFVSGATYSLPTGDALGLGNAGSSGDALGLYDAAGNPVDTVIYGPDNSDGFLDDLGAVASSVAPSPASGATLARVPNGADSQHSGADFLVASTRTPGASNDAATPACDDEGSVPGLVINEVMFDPAGSDTDMEWVEIYLPGGSTADLSGWVLTAGTTSYSTQGSIPAGTTISPGEHLVVSQAALAFSDIVAPGFTMGNASNADAVQLRDCFGNPADTVVYGTDNGDGWLDDQGGLAFLAIPGASGESLSRIPDGTDTDNSTDDFEAGAPTPGASNSVPVATCDTAGAASGLVINEVMPDPAGSDTDMEWVELYFPGGSALDLSGWEITSGTSSFSTSGVFPAGSGISGGSHAVVGQTQLGFMDIVAPGFSLGNASNADALQLRDCFGTPVDTVVYGLDNAEDAWEDDNGNFASIAPKPASGETIARIPDGFDTNDSSLDFQAGFPTPGFSNDAPPVDCGGVNSGLVINELLSNPAGADEGLEWVELYHAGTAPIDLDGWSLQTASSDSWSTRFTFEFDEVLPGEHLLIGGEFVPGATHLLGGSLGNGSGGDGIRVVDCTGFISDTVVYGGVNEDGVVDELGVPASSIAPTPPEEGSIQRVEDGFDTNQSGLDFAVAEVPTPGAANSPIEPVECTPNRGGITINEILPDPDGTDDGLEYIELYNASGDSVSLDGWSISAGTSDFEDFDITLPGGISVPAGGFFVIGGEFVEQADYVIDFSLGNASSSRDGVRLFDCEGSSVDTVIYGVIDEEEPDVGIVDDNDELVDPYADPSSDQALFRVVDGQDTDTAEDWQVGRASPGETNEIDFGPGTDVDPIGGCGCGSGAPSGNAPSGGAPNGEPPTRTGCSTVPAQGSAVMLGLLVAGIRRRRKNTI